MRLTFFSHKYAKEILEHPTYRPAYEEIYEIVRSSPVFVYRGKSSKNARVDVVQQVMHTYFDRKFAIDHDWGYRPLVTNIPDTNLIADFRKCFGDLLIQVEVQFGNMSRWYGDIFKFQAAYSQKIAHIGVSIIPMQSLANRIDSNVVNFERASRELTAATFSITLPILLIGICPDADTQVIDLRSSNFQREQILGKGHIENRLRIVNGYLNGVDIHQINDYSEIGPSVETSVGEEDE